MSEPQHQLDLGQPPGEGWTPFGDKHPPRPGPFPNGHPQRIELFSPERSGIWPKVFGEYLATVHQQLVQRWKSWFGVTHWRPIRPESTEPSRPTRSEEATA